MKEILKKMAQAKQHVKNTKLKREKYFQIMSISPRHKSKGSIWCVSDCGLLTAFSLNWMK